jgi:hypothetical protein
LTLRKLLLPSVFVYFCLLSLLSLSIPFFWDVTFFGRQADYIYSGHWFSALPQDIDMGGFPLYAYWMASAWILFGKTLVVSHLALLPFTLGIAWAFHRLAKKFLTEDTVPWAMLLLCVEPAFLTQSLLMAYDILLLCFFLFALNALFEKKWLLYSLVLILLSFTTKRSIGAVISLGIIQVLMASAEERRQMRFLILYLPVSAAMLAWALIHHQLTGWYFFFPLASEQGEELLSLSGMGKQFVILVWRLIDSGRIFLWLFALASGLLYYRSWKKDPAIKILFLITFVPGLFFLLLLTALSNPPGDRYFLTAFSGLCLLVCGLARYLNAQNRIILFLVLAAGLITGNFWLYPERLSNNWDTSLKVIPFFELKAEMNAFIHGKNIPFSEVATQFPLIQPRQYTDLTSPEPIFINALDGPLNKFHYYLHSNVCNTDLLPQIEAIKPTWRLVKEVKKGQVYLMLFENPAFK